MTCDDDVRVVFDMADLSLFQRRRIKILNPLILTANLHETITIHHEALHFDHPAVFHFGLCLRPPQGRLPPGNGSFFNGSGDRNKGK